MCVCVTVLESLRKLSFILAFEKHERYLIEKLLHWELFFGYAGLFVSGIERSVTSIDSQEVVKKDVIASMLVTTKCPELRILLAESEQVRQLLALSQGEEEDNVILD